LLVVIFLCLLDEQMSDYPNEAVPAYFPTRALQFGQE
jgi:hypothetical protein